MVKRWIVRERLLRIWMQMRVRPEDDGKLAFLAEFFEAWYEGHPGEAVTAAERRRCLRCWGGC